MRKILLLLLFPVALFAAINTWTGVVNTDGNNVLNWSLLALSSTDTLTFTNASAVNCTC